MRAVDGVDLTIEKGEILALVGESGSGKTTTGRVIVKLTRQTAGSMSFDGQDVSTLWGTRGLRDYRRRVQLIFQDPYETLDPKHTIGSFVAEPLVVNHVGGSAEEREKVVVDALEAAGLRPGAAFARRYPHELSGGQRQRVVIAGALVLGPELVVADEPVSMLDVSIRTELLRLMLDLRAERGLTYLFITHDLSLAWVIADRVAVMYLGKIMEIGPANAVISAAAPPVHAGAGVGGAVTRTAGAGRAGASGRFSSARHRTLRRSLGLPVQDALPVAFDRCAVGGAAADRRRRRPRGRVLARETGAGASRRSGKGDR